MVIHGVYIVSKSGGLIYNYDHNVPEIKVEKTFSYPLDIKLRYENKKVVVAFGQRDGIRGSYLEKLKLLAVSFRGKFCWKLCILVGHILYSINGVAVIGSGRQLDNGRDVFETLEDEKNYPLILKFGRPKMTTNEKIFLASMFYPLFAIASQLSPEPKSSGIELLEADSFKLHCFQTLSGMKMMVVADPGQAGMDILLRKMYEIYADYALKNPFYSLEMPIRCELFDMNLKTILEQIEKSGISNIVM